jgi:hypothetical protein
LRKVERDARQRAGQRISPPCAATFLLARFEDPEADCDC